MATQVIEKTDAAAPNGAAAQDWRAGLPEDIRADKSLETFKDIPDLAKSFIATKKMVGNATRIPGPDAKPEEWDTLYNKLGRPEAPDKYEFKRPEVPENVKYDEELETAFRGMAHKAGLSTRQAQAVLEQFTTFSQERLGNFTKQMETGVGELKKEWGAKFDANVGAAARTVKELGGDEIVALLNETGLGNHPAMIKFFAKLGEATSEDSLIIGDNANVQETRDAILLKIHEIENDKTHPYNDAKAPYDVREVAKKQVSALYKQAYGG